MPKKQPRNAFYFFMVDHKEQQRKKGINYANMAEVSEAAGPLWAEASPAVRAKFEAMAKAEKAKSNVPERKFTSFGVSLAEVEAQAREAREAAEAERRDIVNFVKQKSVDQSILDEDIFLMDVNSYCKANGSYLVGELTLLRFTLRHGVKDSYHEVINPGNDVSSYCNNPGNDVSSYCNNPAATTGNDVSSYLAGNDEAATATAGNDVSSYCNNPGNDVSSYCNSPGNDEGSYCNKPR
ncbi:HMG-box domain-containing protein [Phthorimaea operculella]|nr:HMG-box domain-containing protein [Phthorimaea operculella]